MAVFWNWIWEPMLFVTIGWSIDFATLDTGIIPKSLIIICTGKSGLEACAIQAVLTWQRRAVGCMLCPGQLSGGFTRAKEA